VFYRPGSLLGAFRRGGAGSLHGSASGGFTGSAWRRCGR
jgi:hypothetical protein